MSRFFDADARDVTSTSRSVPYRYSQKLDVVEVVRCKDCENWDDRYCCVLDDAFDGEFFCALGERRKH